MTTSHLDDAPSRRTGTSVTDERDPAAGGSAGRGVPATVELVLAALVILAIPLGTTLPLPFLAGRVAAPVQAAALLGGALWVCFCLGVRTWRTPADRGPFLGGTGPLYCAVLALLGVLLLHDPTAPRVLTYAHIAVGTIAGVTLGIVQARSRSGDRVVLTAWTVFLLVASAQVLVAAYGLVSEHGPAAGLRILHSELQTPWGRSNTVAGVLVLVALVVWQNRAKAWGGPLAGIASAVALGSALLTLSRGALLCAAVGGAALLWTHGRRRLRALTPVVAIGVVLLALYVYSRFDEARSSDGFDPDGNVSGRLDLYRDSLASIAAHPLAGTGWLGMQPSGAEGVSVSFAHNVVISFLQIGGLLGLVFVVVIGLYFLRAARDPRFVPFALAALSFALVEPVFENVAGALVIWSVCVRFLAGSDGPATASTDGARVSP